MLFEELAEVSFFLQNRVDFMQLMVNAEASDSNSEDGNLSKGIENRENVSRLYLLRFEENRFHVVVLQD